MITKKKKMKAGREKNIPEPSEELEGKVDSQEHLVNSLAHPGQMGYQILVKLQELIVIFQEQNLLLRERNEILKEDEEDSEEEDEEEEDEEE